MKRYSENFGYIFRLFLNLQFLGGIPGKEGVTKNIDLEILTKNLVKMGVGLRMINFNI